MPRRPAHVVRIVHGSGSRKVVQVLGAGQTRPPRDRAVVAACDIASRSSSAFHSEQSLTVKAAFSTLLPDGREQFATRTFIHDYGGNVRAWNTARDELVALAGVTVTDWPSYRDRHDEVPMGDGLG